MNAIAPSISLAPQRGERVGERGILLVNVGTPDEATVPAVRRYLAEFLNDPRVIDLPTAARWMLLNLIILPFRPHKSTHAYQQVWTPQGSPLLVNSNAQLEALRAALPGIEVQLAMRYGNPSMKAALAAFQAKGIKHITLVPLYPQYASATTGTTVEAWHQLLGAQIEPPATSVLGAFHAKAGFVSALAENVKATVKTIDADHVLFSYHGLPIRQLAPVCAHAAAGKSCGPLSPTHQHCYRAQCLATSEALTAAAGLSHVSTSFQSRLKGATWLSPFTDEVVVELAKKGVKRLAVACPAFVADCLETLEEIGLRAKDSFLQAGGEKFALVPAVNASPQFIAGLAEELRRSAP